MTTGSDNPYIGGPDLQGPGARGFGVPVLVLGEWPEPLEEVEALRAGQAGTTTDLIPAVATRPLDGHTVARCASALATPAVNPLAHFAPPQPRVVAEWIPQIEPDLAVAK
jgi:hypothetical protein